MTVLSVLELWLQSTEDFSTNRWFLPHYVMWYMCFMLINVSYNVLDSHYIQKDKDSASKQKRQVPIV